MNNIESKVYKNGNQMIKISLGPEGGKKGRNGLGLILQQLPKNSYVMIDGSLSKQIDHEVIKEIYHFKNIAAQKNIWIILKNISK